MSDEGGEGLSSTVAKENPDKGNFLNGVQESGEVVVPETRVEPIVDQYGEFVGPNAKIGRFRDVLDRAKVWYRFGRDGLKRGFWRDALGLRKKGESRQILRDNMNSIVSSLDRAQEMEVDSQGNLVPKNPQKK